MMTMIWNSKSMNVSFGFPDYNCPCRIANAKSAKKVAFLHCKCISGDISDSAMTDPVVRMKRIEGEMQEFASLPLKEIIYAAIDDFDIINRFVTKTRTLVWSAWRARSWPAGNGGIRTNTRIRIKDIHGNGCMKSMISANGLTSSINLICIGIGSTPLGGDGKRNSLMTERIDR